VNANKTPDIGPQGPREFECGFLQLVTNNVSNFVGMVMLQYCQHLHKHPAYLEPVKQSFQSLIDGIADDSIILLVCFAICPVVLMSGCC